MSGMNLIFHTLAAVALVVLLHALARLRAERDFLRMLAREASQSGGPRRLVVEEPARFLRRFAAAWGLPFEESSPLAGGPQRIEPTPFLELFLRRGLVLIRCGEAGVELHVVRAEGSLAQDAEGLSRALGGVSVKILAAC